MKHFASRSSRSGSPKPRFQYSTSKRSKVLRCPRVARKYAELNQNASGFTDSRSANACAAFQRNGIRLPVYTRVVSPSRRVNRVIKMLNDTINRTYTHETESDLSCDFEKMHPPILLTLPFRRWFSLRYKKYY